jgi:hypothetical protein
MKFKKSIITLLLVSFGFNAFFALGFLRMRQIALQIATEEGRFRFLCEKMQVAETDCGELWRIRLESLRQVAAVREKQKDVHEEFWRQIASDEVDSARIQELLRKTGSAREAVLRIRVRSILELSRAVTPAQRAVLIRMVRQAGDPGGLLLKTD